ncbi:class I SAM-dependent methyltransferase [Microlunatus sp. GCM10028923]|uniref:class I SAM-dependent methyltransferase n=1 Tax=Microlunatus sp. GCM10028923 TaxID=3273400 RepID=UPI003605BB62
MNQQTVGGPADTEADRALKAKHRALWALGDYPAVAADVVAPLGPILVDAAGVTATDRVLDTAAGTGNAAIAAALTGAEVIATDLTPELLATGERFATEHGVRLTWQEADVEALPFPDAEFDVVLSCIGAMFAPHHRRTADELLRVCRTGGRIAMINWTPEGFIGQLFATMKPYAPPPPPGAEPPPRWGDEDHLQEVFGNRVRDLTVRRQELVVDHFADGAALRDYFKLNYGPTIVTYRAIADDPDRVAALDQALVDLVDRYQSAGSMPWEYLVVVGEKG